ncbi:DegV family EDD domain-containing protein [bacterium]|nr:MAG: DegV family EDD domain-containing protein [bacterium]
MSYPQSQIGGMALKLKIKYLDGIRLKRSVIAGCNFVINKKDHLNNINVFPVPDGDTGTNMASTLKTIADTAENEHEHSIESMSCVLADSALMGARGNSGVILAQFFQGLQDGLKGSVRANTQKFSEAVSNATQSAWSAMSKPVEGTILSVIRDWAKSVEAKSKKTDDFSELFKESLNDARISLANTPKQMAVLAKAGVVDAGAEGFVTMLEGILNFIESGRISDIKRVGLSESEEEVMEPHLDDHTIDDIKFQFCTECLLVGDNMSRENIREKISSFGDSLIVAGSPKKIKIHLHSNTPEDVFDVLADYGHVVSTKIDDMRQQFANAHSDVVQETAIAVDSCVDLPLEYIRRNHIHVIPLNVHFGDQVFIDRLTLTPKKFYEKLSSSPDHPKSSQPTPQRFKESFERLLTIYPQVISLHLSSKMSGTYQGALSIAKSVGKGKIHVVDTQSASVGAGLIVQEIEPMILANEPVEKILAHIDHCVKNMNVFISVQTMEFLIKGGRVSKTRGAVAKTLNIKPILGIKEGAVVPIAKAFGHSNALRKVMELVKAAAKGKKNLRFGIAHANSIGIADWYATELVKYFEIDRDKILITDVSTVIATHAGPGAAAIAVLCDP